MKARSASYSRTLDCGLNIGRAAADFPPRFKPHSGLPDERRGALADRMFVSYYAARKKLVDALNIKRKEASHLIRHATMNGMKRVMDPLQPDQKLDVESSSWVPSHAWYADEDL